MQRFKCFNHRMQTLLLRSEIGRTQQIAGPTRFQNEGPTRAHGLGRWARAVWPKKILAKKNSSAKNACKLKKIIFSSRIF